MTDDNLSQYPLPINILEERIGYVFSDKNLIKTAMTHSSFANEAHGGASCSNERMEFFGDSVLSLVVSEYLFENYEEMQEGELTRIRSRLVCEDALAEYAEKINLGDFLYLGHGEEKNNGRRRKSTVSDAMEALLAAVYMDDEGAGGDGKSAVSRIILPFVMDELEKISDITEYFDYKTLLQQVVQQGGSEALEYAVTGESGPDHDKTFSVEVKLNSNIVGHGTGRSKRSAEQMAAKEALGLFGVDVAG
ncbi:MAG: ribonuclease III [Firmicutes bacterium]|nr:ribonuclease III [Bacillota bacterium]